MNKTKIFHHPVFSFVLPLTLFFSCANGSPAETKGASADASLPNGKKGQAANPITKVSPSGNTVFRQGDPIVFSYESKQPFDSTALFINGKKEAVLTGTDYTKQTSTEDPVGITGYRLEGYAGGNKWSRSGSYTLLPKSAPAKYRVKIVKTYPHQTNAYTQGLEFYNGKLYESSGEYGLSYLHRMEFPSMKSEKETKLEPIYFAEGLTILKGKMYLLTWQEKRGFVYDPETLVREKEFEYATEGWGLANDGKNLYMSDGSQYIYTLDPETLQTTGKIQVYNDEGEVGLINEMEWIGDELWANVYGYNFIVRINPRTGAVTGVVDASPLIGEIKLTRDTDVLNGIAFDGSKIYLTGKNWNKLFEVEIVKQ